MKFEILMRFIASKLERAKGELKAATRAKKPKSAAKLKDYREAMPSSKKSVNKIRPRFAPSGRRALDFDYRA